MKLLLADSQIGQFAFAEMFSDPCSCILHGHLSTAAAATSVLILALPFPS